MTVDSTRTTPLALVVDDDGTTRLLARAALEQSGLEVEEAENGKEAIEIYQRRRPDIVIMDVMMPEMDGFEACAAMRRLPGGDLIPVLLMTGLDDEESILHAYDAGATDFVTKPWNGLVLSQRVRYMLRASSTLEALHKNEARLAQAQHLAHLGNWVWTIALDTLEVSKEVYRIIGSEPEMFRATQEGYLAYVHSDDRAKVTTAFKGIVTDGAPFSMDHRILRPDGMERIVHQQAELEYDSQGAPLRLVGTIQDVTDQKRKEQALAQASELMEWQNLELARARDKALAAVKLKDEFLANMSHELLTPMNGLLGMSSLLVDTDLSDEQKEYVQTIQGSGETLLRLIKDVLDFTKMGSDGVHLESAKFGVRPAVEETIKPLLEEASRKGLACECRFHEEVPAVVRGDQARLCQIVTNLMGNAVKFTERGTVSLEVMMLRESGDGVVLRFAVEDTGIGIPPDARSRLFQLFTQVDGSSTRRHGGSGLGLVISKRLTELMGGQIGVESEPGQGSTFWFTVQLGRG